VGREVLPSDIHSCGPLGVWSRVNAKRVHGSNDRPGRPAARLRQRRLQGSQNGQDNQNGEAVVKAWEERNALLNVAKEKEEQVCHAREQKVVDRF